MSLQNWNKINIKEEKFFEHNKYKFHMQIETYITEHPSCIYHMAII